MTLEGYINQKSLGLNEDAALVDFYLKQAGACDEPFMGNLDRVAAKRLCNSHKIPQPESVSGGVGGVAQGKQL